MNCRENLNCYTKRFNAHNTLITIGNLKIRWPVYWLQLYASDKGLWIRADCSHCHVDLIGSTLYSFDSSHRWSTPCMVHTLIGAWTIYRTSCFGPFKKVAARLTTAGPRAGTLVGPLPYLCITHWVLLNNVSGSYTSGSSVSTVLQSCYICNTCSVWWCKY